MLLLEDVHRKLCLLDQVIVVKVAVTVLSRSSNVPEHLSPIASKITVKAVDYTSHASLVSGLTGVHTVICTLGDPDSLYENQTKLLAAAKEAGFAPADIALGKLTKAAYASASSAAAADQVFAAANGATVGPILLAVGLLVVIVGALIKVFE